ncbi:GNAT family N-acetyltransferase [Caldithrix abyssi]|nr:GNAT family N-acetyltransferase [Caldithrix abyssi]
MDKEIREIKETDIEFVIDYFISATPDFLHGMGADSNKLPNKEEWIKLLQKELKKENNEKEFYYIIWLIEGKPIGHSNINKIQYGKEAFMHLHLWKSDKRKKGIGSYFIQKTIPHFFNNFELEELYCEPYSLNPASNKILQKIGFEFIKEYETTPGWINFHQKVTRWVMTRKRFEEKIKIAYNKK